VSSPPAWSQLHGRFQEALEVAGYTPQLQFKTIEIRPDVWDRYSTMLEGISEALEAAGKPVPRANCDWWQRSNAAKCEADALELGPWRPYIAQSDGVRHTLDLLWRLQLDSDGSSAVWLAAFLHGIPRRFPDEWGDEPLPLVSTVRECVYGRFPRELRWQERWHSIPDWAPPLSDLRTIRSVVDVLDFFARECVKTQPRLMPVVLRKGGARGDIGALH